MITRHSEPWEETGSRSATSAGSPGGFINQHVSPLLLQRTEGVPSVGERGGIVAEEQFWREEGRLLFGAVRLSEFRLTDWFPRAPGVYWSRHARAARETVWAQPSTADPELGEHFSPESKMGLIEEGGIGTIRLRPRRIDGEVCWLATALTGAMCSGGIPLAIPDLVLRRAGVRWGDVCTLEGRVRFLQDVGLDEPASRVHHARPLIVFVERLEGVATRRAVEPIIISPVALFTTRASYPQNQYAFAYCKAGPDAELDAAVDWIERYASRYAGRVITNFDEQRPVLADAPLSYQRLVAKTYDRAVIERFSGTMLADRIEQVVQQSVTDQYFGAVHIGGAEGAPMTQREGNPQTDVAVPAVEKILSPSSSPP